MGPVCTMTNNRVWRLQTIIGKFCTGNHQFFDLATVFTSETREIFRITRKLTLVKETIIIVRVREIR